MNKLFRIPHRFSDADIGTRRVVLSLCIGLGIALSIGLFTWACTITPNNPVFLACNDILSVFHPSQGKAEEGFQQLRILRTIFVLPLLFFLAGIIRRWSSARQWGFATIFSLILGLFLRFDLWWTKSFWVDTWSLKAGLMTHSLRQLATGPIGFNQSAPVGFSLLGRMLGILSGWNGKVLTFPSLLCSILTLWLLVDVIRKSLSGNGLVETKPTMGLFSFIVAVNPIFVYYAAEFKPYGFDLLMATLALRFYFWFRDSDPVWFALALFTILAPFFSLPSFFVLSFLYLCLLRLFSENKPALRRLILTGVCCAPLAILPLVHAVKTMPNVMYRIESLFAPVSASSASVYWWVRCFLHWFRGPAYFGITPWNICSPWIVLSGVPISLFLLGCHLRRREPWLWMCILVTFAVFAASACRYWKIYPGAGLLGGRLILFLVPFSYLPLATGFHWLTHGHRVIARILTCFSSASLLFFFVHETPNSAPMAAITNHLVQTFKNGDMLLADEIMASALCCEQPQWVSKQRPSLWLWFSSPSCTRSEFEPLRRFFSSIDIIDFESPNAATMESIHGELDDRAQLALFYPPHWRTHANPIERSLAQGLHFDDRRRGLFHDFACRRCDGRREPLSSVAPDGDQESNEHPAREERGEVGAH